MFFRRSRRFPAGHPVLPGMEHVWPTDRQREVGRRWLPICRDNLRQAADRLAQREAELRDKKKEG